MAKIEAIYRYPVKGLSAEPLVHTRLERGKTINADRRYAIENGPSGFEPAVPKYLPKNRFLMLMRNERLARLESRYDATTTVLTLREGTREVARGSLSTSDGRAKIEAFFADFGRDDLRGAPRILQSPGHSFSDVARKVVSIINLASVVATEDAIGAPVDPLRFRGNLYVSGWPAWHEFDLMNRTVAIGHARLKVVKRIQRCAAVDVEPHTGHRDLAIPATLLRAFGHADCGVYGEVLDGGDISVGDTVGLAEGSPTS